MESETTKKNIIKKIWGGIKKPFGFIKRKSAPAREFMKKGRAGGMILELILGSQFMIWMIDSYTNNKIPDAAIFFIGAAFLALCTELTTLLFKLVFAGGKRCRGYFLMAWVMVSFTDIVANQGECIPAALLTGFLLALAVNVTGRIAWGFIKTRRFKQVFAYVAIVLCAVIFAGFAYVYHNDNFGESRIEYYTSIAPANEAQQVQGFDAYMQDGPYEVAELSYGPEEDNDIVTDTLDFTVYDQIEQMDGMSSFLMYFTDYDFAETPVKGEIWYPQGQTNCPVFFMVHGNHDSYVPSYLGYDYLGQSLASHGYVVVSVDENIINGSDTGNDLRAILLLENMKTIFALNEDDGSAIAGLINEDLVAIGGHSRGGEMVATAYLFNDLDYYPEDGNVQFDYHFNITSIVAIAPVVDQYRPIGRSVEISDVNYLLIHGSNDQDVSIMMGEKQYNNISFTGEEFCFKTSVYILGANHGQFNNQWGRYDYPGSPEGFLNTNNFLSQDDQQFIACAYIRVFLDTTLGIDNTYEELMSNVDAFRSFLPDTVYVTNYQDSNFVPLATFGGTVDIAAFEEASVEVTGADTWTLVPYDRGSGGVQENYMLDVIWLEESEPSVEFTFEPIDVSEGIISFGIVSFSDTDAENAEGGLDYTVTLTDASGNTVTVNCPDFVYLPLAVQLYKDNVFFGSYEYKHQITTVTVTAEDFADAGDFDFSAVTGVTITTDGTEEGEFLIDNLGYYAVAY